MPPFSGTVSSWTHSDRLGAIAISGYVLFLPWDSQPDISTLLLLVFGLVAINRHDCWSRLSRLDAAVVAVFVISAILSTLLSEEPARSFRFFVYLCFNVFILLLAAGIRSQIGIRILTGCLALVGFLHLVSLLISFHAVTAGNAGSLVRQAYMNTMIVPNDALILGLCLPSLLFFLRGERTGRNLLFYAVAGIYLVLSVYASYRLQSKITLLSLGAALLIAVAAPRICNLPKLVGFLGALVVLSASAWIFGNQSTTRLSLWVTAGTAHDNVTEVLFGAGPNTFLYDPAVVDSSFDKGDLVIPWAHNLFLEVFYEQGLLGLLGIFALTLIPVLRTLKIEDAAIRSLLMASAITLFLLTMFEITLTRRFYFAYLAVIYGLAAAHTTRTQS